MAVLQILDPKLDVKLEKFSGHENEWQVWQNSAESYFGLLGWGELMEAAKQHPDAHFANLFPIVGIKHHESADKRDHVWKGRIVLGGNNIKTAKKQQTNKKTCIW